MRRKNSLRLPYYTYESGYFLVTINTLHRRKLLGNARGESFVPNALGELVFDAMDYVWTAKRGVDVRAHQQMPEHLHAVLGLDGTRGTLGSMVGSAKSRATRLAGDGGLLTQPGELWQRGYDARWLGDEHAVRRAVAYTQMNPVIHARRKRRRR